MKKIQFSSFGFSSILLIFVMICIVTFSTLTLVTANSDYKLSKKVADKSTNYFNGEAELYHQIATIDEKCMNAYYDTSDADDFYSAMNLSDSHEIKLTQNISSTQYIEVILNVNYPDSGHVHFLEIKKWCIVNVPIEIEDAGLNLIGD